MTLPRSFRPLVLFCSWTVSVHTSSYLCAAKSCIQPLIKSMASALLLSYSEILLAAACFLFLFLYLQFRRKSAAPINWPLFGMLPDLIWNLHRFHDWITEVLRESGSSFKIRGPWLFGADFLLTCDPANVNHVFNVNFSNYPKGEEFLEIFDILGDGIFNADDESWKGQRKMAHAAMNSPDFRAFVADCSRGKMENVLVPLVRDIAERGEVVDLQDVFLRLTFDLTCDLVFGVDPECLSEGFPSIPFARAMDDAMEALFLRHLVPPSWWKLMRRLRIGKEKKLIEARKVIDDFAAQNILKKKGDTVYKQDLLTSYIKEKADDHKFLRDTAVNLMLAGRDTTGVALAWFFWLLSKNPEVKSKIIRELKENDDVTKSVYLHAALCETLRLFPPVPLEHKAPLQPEILPSGDRAVPKEKVLFSTYSMGRMEGVWGRDCLEFKPERWISDKGRLRHEPSYKFLSFNCGPRTCLGKEVAFTQMKIVVAAMLLNFDVEVVEGHAVEPKASIILHMRNGLLVKVKKREEDLKMVNGN